MSKTQREGIARLSAKEEVILTLLRSARSGKYGLQLVRESDGVLKQGTVYVTLGRMQEKGLVTCAGDLVAPRVREIRRLT